MRGVPCNTHPPDRVGKKDSCCGRKDKHVEAEDHGNGYLFVGTSDIDQAQRLLAAGLGKKKARAYRYAARIWYENRACAVWLTDSPGQFWDGATNSMGKPVREWGDGR